MNNTIEDIWRDGFLKEDALIAPKINDFYNQKSKNLVDKIKKMLKMNLYFIFALAILALGLYYVLGFGYIGLIIATALLYLTYVGKKQWSEMQEINIGENSYTYLKSFDNWLKKSIAANIKIMRIFYPVMFITAIITIISTIQNTEKTKHLLDLPEYYSINGVPYFVVLAVLSIAGIISYYSDKIYMFDLNLFYKSVFKKLTQTILDMEELLDNNIS